MTLRYLLDTNTVSYFIRGHAAVAGHVVALPMASLFISAITEGELRFGVERRPDARKLNQAVREFLRRIDVLEWDRFIAARYGMVRAEMESRGRPLAPLDLLIGVHALALDMTLVTSDRAFSQIERLRIEDWTQP